MRSIGIWKLVNEGAEILLVDNAREIERLRADSGTPSDGATIAPLIKGYGGQYTRLGGHYEKRFDGTTGEVYQCWLDGRLIWTNEALPEPEPELPTEEAPKPKRTRKPKAA